MNTENPRKGRKKATEVGTRRLKHIRMSARLEAHLKALAAERGHTFNKVVVDTLQAALVEVSQEPLRRISGDDEMTIRTDAEGNIQ